MKQLKDNTKLKHAYLKHFPKYEEESEVLRNRIPLRKYLQQLKNNMKSILEMDLY